MVVAMMVPDREIIMVRIIASVFGVFCGADSFCMIVAREARLGRIPRVCTAFEEVLRPLCSLRGTTQQAASLRFRVFGPGLSLGTDL